MKSISWPLGPQSLVRCQRVTSENTPHSSRHSLGTLDFADTCINSTAAVLLLLARCLAGSLVLKSASILAKTTHMQHTQGYSRWEVAYTDALCRWLKIHSWTANVNANAEADPHNVTTAAQTHPGQTCTHIPGQREHTYRPTAKGPEITDAAWIHTWSTSHNLLHTYTHPGEKRGTHSSTLPLHHTTAPDIHTYAQTSCARSL